MGAGKFNFLFEVLKTLDCNKLMALTILTLALGKDYCRNLEKALKSKVDYAKAHGYTYIQGDETFWDRDRPISWSKVPFLLHHLEKLPENALVWLSDADVYITNKSIKFEDHVLSIFKDNKQMLMTFDACGHVNAGNIVMRNTAWIRNFWRRVYQQTDVIYHIWWENAGIDKLMNSDTEVKEAIQVTNEHKRFNAYLMGFDEEPKWEHGDLLVHFAGVYDSGKMKDLMDRIDNGETPRLSMY